MNYIEVSFENIAEEQKDLLTAYLSQWEHNGILEESNQIKVYFKKEDLPEEAIKQLAQQFNSEPKIQEIQEQNWNSNWEESFQPVVIDDFCAIRADFHQPINDVKYELIVTPKMSFGTGHHATTAQMIKLMSQLDFREKDVFDFGCGTAVLSILAEKMGAANIIATDIDDWAIENSIENISRNHCKKINVSNKPVQDIFENSTDIILANINRNALLASMDTLNKVLKSGGLLLMSGFYAGKDEEMIINSANENNLKQIKQSEDNQWVATMFKKQ